MAILFGESCDTCVANVSLRAHVSSNIALLTAAIHRYAAAEQDVVSGVDPALIRLRMGHTVNSLKHKDYATGNHPCMNGDSHIKHDYTFGAAGCLDVNNLVFSSDNINPPLSNLTPAQKEELIEKHKLACSFLTPNTSLAVREQVIEALAGSVEHVLAGVQLGEHVDLGMAAFPGALQDVPAHVLPECPRALVPQGAVKLDLSDLPTTGVCVCVCVCVCNGSATRSACPAMRMHECCVHVCSVHLGTVQRAQPEQGQTPGTHCCYQPLWWWPERCQLGPTEAGAS